MQQKRKSDGQPLWVELQNYERQGISIWLEGSKSNSREVTQALCVRETNNYMRDYVFQQGALREVHFDRVGMDPDSAYKS